MCVCVSHTPAWWPSQEGNEMPQELEPPMVVSILEGAGTSSGRPASARAESSFAVLYLIDFATVSPTERENVPLARPAGQWTPKMGLRLPSWRTGVTD